MLRFVPKLAVAMRRGEAGKDARGDLARRERQLRVRNMTKKELKKSGGREREPNTETQLFEVSLAAAWLGLTSPRLAPKSSFTRMEPYVGMTISFDPAPTRRDDDAPRGGTGSQVLPVAELPEDFEGEPDDGSEYLFLVRSALPSPCATAILTATAVPDEKRACIRPSTARRILTPSTRTSSSSPGNPRPNLRATALRKCGGRRSSSSSKHFAL